MARRNPKTPATKAEVSTASKSASSASGHGVCVGLALSLLAIVAFLPSVRNDFVNFDDPVYVYDNVHVQQGFTPDAIRWALTSVEGGFWHPLTWLSIILDVRLYGLWAGGHHLTSLLLHAANTMALFFLLRRMTGAHWRAAFVAALFAVHPLHVESVAWASERKDVLSTFFWFLSLLMYVRYAEGARSRRPEVEVGILSSILHLSSLWYCLSLLLFVCGLMSKAMLVTLPLQLVLLDWWPLRRFEKVEPAARTPTTVYGRYRALLLEKLPFLLIAAIFSVLTLQAQKAIDALPTNEEIPFRFRVGNAILSYAQYVLEMFWPADLAAYYGFPSTVLLWKVVAVAGIGLLFSALVWRQSSRRPYLAFGWLWYGITLLPVSGIIQAGGQSHADRYTYVPLIGLFVLLTWFGHERARQASRLRLATGLAALAVCLCLILAWRQVQYWRDSEALFRRILSVSEPSALAESGLGSALVARGRPDEGIAHLRQAVALAPDSSDAHSNLGAALGKKGLLDEAILHLQRAIQLKPGNAAARCNLADGFAAKGLLNEAIEEYRSALRIKSDDPLTHFNFGLSLTKAGRLDEARVQFEECLRLKPDQAAYNQLGLVLGMQGHSDEAAAHLRKAVKLNPDSAEAHCNLGIVLLNQAKLDEAIAELTTALQLNPKDAKGHCNLGVALARQGQLDAAIVHLQQATQLSPGYVDAENNLQALRRVQSGSTNRPPR
jgi:tetratricopeptide (TPR) repeat protein